MPGKPCRVGNWMFLPAANELRRGDDLRRLEFRAARTLELLCRSRGAVVSQEEILREVWNGRATSGSSVPVVIKDLRQALGDDAREPRYIETVAKRGYRLLSGPDEEPPIAETKQMAKRKLPSAFRLGIGALVLLAVAMFAWPAMREEGAALVPLIVTEVENVTGDDRHQPLASAASEVIMSNAQRMPGVEAFRGVEHRPPGAVTLSARLIIWNDKPTVMMTAQREGGVMVWSGMTSGEEALIPGEVSAAMDELGEKLGSP